MIVKNIQDVVSNHYDLAFIGSGASTSYSIIALCEQYKNADKKPLRVLIVEASGEFCAGVAYGQRSGENALILTRLDQFYPPDELMLFAAWVREAQCELEVWACEKPGFIDNLAKLSLPEYALTLGRECIKRHFVGEFIAWRVKSAINSLPTNSGLEVHFVNATALNFPTPQNFVNDTPISVMLSAGLSNGGAVEGEFTSSKLVLAVGTRPRVPLNINGHIPVDFIPSIINDPYQGEGLDANHKRMMRSIQSRTSEVVRVLVLGSNASAMESIYLLSSWSESTGNPIDVVVVSTLGDFPAKISDVVDDSVVSVPEIHEYLAQGEVSSDGLYSAALDGLKRLKIEGKSLDCYNRSIDLAVLDALKIMKTKVRMKFLREKCNALGRYKRRAEKHYHTAVTSMVDSGTLTIQTGRVNSISVTGNKVVTEIESSDGSLLYLQCDGVINCGASESLSSQSSNPLIASLVSSGIVEVDSSGGCFKTVNGGFSVAKNFYIMGPLLAGNYVNGEPVWHLEHCGRIIKFSKALASELLESFKETRQSEEA